MTAGRSDRAAGWSWVLLASAVGVAVELVVSQVGHRRESWDSSAYWTLGVPAMIVGALIVGFFARGSRVRIGYAPFVGQLITMAVRTGGGSMLPLGIIFVGIIGLSGVLGAGIGVWLGKRILGNAVVPDDLIAEGPSGGAGR